MGYIYFIGEGEVDLGNTQTAASGVLTTVGGVDNPVWTGTVRSVLVREVHGADLSDDATLPIIHLVSTVTSRDEAEHPGDIVRLGKDDLGKWVNVTAFLYDSKLSLKVTNLPEATVATFKFFVIGEKEPI